jgi:perosamine synthetase
MIPHSQPWITEHDKILMGSLLDSRMLSNGVFMSKLELELAQFLNKKYAIFTGNGTQAQVLILKALGIGPGDEVILPTYVCDKVLKGILFVGATPVFCDVNRHWVMDEKVISDKVSKNTKAIILVHIFGINAYKESLKKFNIPIIEDVCQSIGGNGDEKTGSYTGYAFASFHGTKMLTSGEGGMLFLNDKEIYEKCLLYQKKSGVFNRGTDIAASLLLNQLSRIDENVINRCSIAKRYSEELPKQLVDNFKKMPNSTINFRYLMTTQNEFEKVKNAYQLHGIAVRKGVDALLHLDYKEFNKGNYKTSEELFKTTVSIPILPQMTDSEINHVITITNQLYNKGELC